MNHLRPCHSVARVAGVRAVRVAMAHRLRHGALAVILAAALAACSSPPPPRDNHYRLETAPAVAALARPVFPGVMEVNRLDVDGLLSERGLVYQDADGTLARWRYDLWSDPPATAVQMELAEALRAANMAEQVVTPDLRVPPDWMVRGRLFRFEALPAQGKVAIKLQLAAVSARDGTLVLLKTYVSEPAMDGKGPEAAVTALNRGVSELLSRFVSDLSQVTPPVSRR